MQIRGVVLVPVRPRALFVLGPTRRRQDNPLAPNEKRSLRKQSGTQQHLIPLEEIAVHYGRQQVLCYIGILVSVSLPAGLFMGEEQVPLRHFNAPLTWPAAMSRLNLISTDMTTKNKGNQREQLLSISHPFHSSSPPSLYLSSHPFYSYY